MSPTMGSIGAPIIFRHGLVTSTCGHEWGRARLIRSLEEKLMAKKKAADEVISFKLRMPEGLRQKIEAEALKAERSMNSEILYRLGQTFGPEWQRFINGVEEQERRDEKFRRKMVEQLLQDPEFVAKIDRLSKEER